MLTRFLSDQRGLETMEYIILGAIMVLILAASFVGLFNAIQDKLKGIASSL
jgi:Flp pilus assembly pilin Flp